MKIPAWIRRAKVHRMAGEPLPKRAGNIDLIECKLLCEYDGLQEWECYGWKTYDDEVYGLWDYDPNHCPAEAVPIVMLSPLKVLEPKGV